MQNKNPLVSIIIPTYNRGHLISETLDSILDQTYTNWECIVVDDRSTDNTDQVMREYCRLDDRFQYHHRPKDKLKGGNASRNFGFELSKGEYIQWFDSDDLMLPKKIEIQLNAIIDNESDFSVCGGAEFTNDPLTFKKKWKLIKEDNLLFNHIKGSVVFGTNGPLFKKKYLLKKHLFNESLIIRQEWEFFNRLLILTPKVILISDVLYLYRSIENSIRTNLSYEKIKCKMITNRLILIKVNESRVFNKEVDFLYRRFVFMGILDNLKLVNQNKKYKDYYYLFITFSRIINIDFLITSLSILLRKPIVLKNIMYSIFFKRTK